MMTRESFMRYISMKNLLSITVSSLILSGCATAHLITEGNPYTTTDIKKVTLVEDDVLALAKPTKPLENTPAHSIVIVGKKNSYVLTQGGQELMNLLSYLDPKYIQVTRNLDFYSEKNDGFFQGSLDLSYVKLKEDFNKADIDFMLRHNGQECSTRSDEKINAQRFCFKTQIQGAVYPAVSNLMMIQSKFKPLSQPYQVSIYTKVNQERTVNPKNHRNPIEKLVLLPFALAFDVATLPLQIFVDD